jgi:hypothetical protein
VGGDYNTAAGHQSLSFNTIGNNNSAFGYMALHNNDDGGNNTAMGYWALYDSDNGTGNTAIGSWALENTDIGDYNTAIGVNALEWNTQGNNNTAVGVNSGPTQGNFGLSNTTCIGYGADVFLDSRVCIGNTSVSWIGGNVTWSTYSDERMKENIREDVKGLDFIMKLRPVTYHLNKDKADNIKGVVDRSSYPSKYDIEKIKQTGFLAQEVEQAAIESGYDFSGVTAPANENTPYSLSYSQFVVPLVKAVQEQQEIIEELKEEIQKQNKEIEELKQRK